MGAANCSDVLYGRGNRQQSAAGKRKKSSGWLRKIDGLLGFEIMSASSVNLRICTPRIWPARSFKANFGFNGSMLGCLLQTKSPASQSRRFRRHGKRSGCSSKMRCPASSLLPTSLQCSDDRRCNQCCASVPVQLQRRSLQRCCKFLCRRRWVRLRQAAVRAPAHPANRLCLQYLPSPGQPPQARTWLDSHPSDQKSRLLTHSLHWIALPLHHRGHHRGLILRTQDLDSAVHCFAKPSLQVAHP
mmetsp:Transcript_18105/g.41994  ORF Transcript_18105/g.41994 Transcript_18105/m.41994 type:complete len:244 (-) Transcript_18105:2683-3414(-)